MVVDLTKPGVDLKVNYRVGAVGPSPPATFPRAATSVLASEITGARAAINGTYFNTASYDSGNPTATWGGGTTYLKVDNSVVHTFDGTNVNTTGMALLFNSVSDVAITRRPGGGWAGVAGSWGNMMACGPVLLEGGVVEGYDVSNTHATARHPRSAVGVTADDKLILLTVDGRTDQAAGMSCTELAQVIKELGAVDAINFDGGGSTTLWANGEPYSGVVNFPSDNSAYDHLGQRSAANALVVVANAPATADWDGRVVSVSDPGLLRSGDTFTVTASYTNIGTQTWTPSTVKLVPSRSIGRSSSFIPSGSESTFAVMSPASVATGQTATFTMSFTAPSVAVDTLYTEHFALEHTTNGYFGPADDEVQFATTVRPPLSGAPPTTIVQGGGSGANNQWYQEPSGTWANSTVAFTAPGVADPGSQRYVSASATGRQASFSPVFDVAGRYTVEVAFPSSSNSVTVQYAVSHLGGTSTFNINQNSSAALTNQWNLLGEFEFGTGTSGSFGVHSITVGNPSTTGNRFYSGAIRLDYVGPLSEVDEWMVYH
ncbi:hypothetical protein GC173_00685 [bacterium]|nr:hypothetical protein [bacterium]